MVGFADLFQGRDDAYGLVHGESVKAPVRGDEWRDHLEVPDHSLGIYPMIEADDEFRSGWEADYGIDGGKFYVKWGCSDIDLPADLATAATLAWNLHAALHALGITAWVERTKGKGYHVWVFAQDWVPAVVMRRAFLVAHQLAGVSATEVNPKQVTTQHLKGGLGNYVNLPYPFGYEETLRRVMVPLLDEERAFYPLPEFLAEATVTRVPFAVLYEAAKLHKEPPKRKQGPMVEPDAEASVLAQALNGLGYKVWREGPLEGRDRSGTLARFAHLCAGQGIAAGTALVLLRDADRRWGKFSDREDGEDQLLKMIEAAYR